MQVDTKALAENLREIAKRPSLGTFARGFVETAADGLLALEADNSRLADGLVRYRSALIRIRDTIELQGEFDRAGGFHLDNIPACIVAKALLGLEERGDPAPRLDNLDALGERATADQAAPATNKALEELPF